MSEGKLKTAVLGLDNGGQLLLKVASKINSLQIQALADRDTKLAEKLADQYKCAFYDDYRQLIIQDQLDCLLVAAGMHDCDEYIRMAMKKKCNVLKLAPAARNFAEAAELVQLAEQENIKFAVANSRRYAKSYLAFRDFLQRTKSEQIFLITAFFNLPMAGPILGWQTDPKLSGGGVLLRNCYEIIDQITLNFGLPQQVYSLNTSQAQDKQQRLYAVEDTALVAMKFSDTLIGNLIAFRCAGSGPGEEFLKIHGRDEVITVNNSEVTITDGMGQTRERLQFDDDEFCRMTELLKNFALSILSPDENKLCSSGKENLKNMAVIESAYLSARTSTPEEPARIFLDTERH